MNVFVKAVRVLLFVFLAIPVCAYSQLQSSKVQSSKQNWHLLDKNTNGVLGISLSQGYEFLKSKGLKGKPVIVAILDGGIDTSHEDLKKNLWKNPREMPGNEIDDDKNGYIDDVFGWNFLGNKDGRNVIEDSYEYMRQFYLLQKKYEYLLPSEVSLRDKAEYEGWTIARDEMKNIYSRKGDTTAAQKSLIKLKFHDKALQEYIGKTCYAINELLRFEPRTKAEDSIKIFMKGFFYNHTSDSLETNVSLIEAYEERIKSVIKKIRALYEKPEDYRNKVTLDNESDINDKFYGNGDVMAGNPSHGTHVAGIIAAVRDNGIGIDGIASQVQIMTVRVIPTEGDEHDKDIALAIYYAVDNGAKIINMSFVKSISPRKQWIDEAVKYAESKNVLIVHAAGNDARDLNVKPVYPNPRLTEGNKNASNWITVGSSTDPLIDLNSQNYMSSFSNYGKEQVDVFAPGSRIYSCLPGDQYGAKNGTSMAAPIVSGIAALLIGHFPSLKPSEIKDIIERSTIKIPQETVKTAAQQKNITLLNLCKTGGIVNAYEAVRYAYEVIRKKSK